MLITLPTRAKSSTKAIGKLKSILLVYITPPRGGGPLVHPKHRYTLSIQQEIYPGTNGQELIKSRLALRKVPQQFARKLLSSRCRFAIHDRIRMERDFP